jgi:agmatine deiminase
MTAFFDKYTDTVYFAACLKERYPSIFAESVIFLKSQGVKVKLLKGTENIWCRDYMPVQVGDHFVKFRYADSNFKHRKKPDPSLYKQFDCIPSNIYLDGGNIMRFGYKTFITEQVMKDNPGLKVTKLEGLLESEIILLPVEPYDDLGHSDGILNFTPEGVLLINDYRSMKKDYWHRYYRKLTARLVNFCIRHLPNAFEKTPKMTEKQFRKAFPFADDFGSGFGYYMNFLQVKDAILLPKFNIKEDEIVWKKMRECFPTNNIKQIDCSKLSLEGGLLHCVSWNIKGV